MNQPSNTDAWLAGVCSRIAGIFGFKAWVLRVIFILLFITKTLLAVMIYAALAAGFLLWDRGTRAQGPRENGLRSPELSGRGRRIDELDRQFREWERSLDR